MGGFSTLNTAVSGLTAAQRGMDVTGQNIVNANTPGYSRQVVKLASVNAPITADYHTRNYGAMIGGVSVEDVSRIRDAFLEGTRAAAGSAMESLTAQTSGLTGVETLLAEPGDGGLQKVMDGFYNGWHELSTVRESGNAGAGAQVIANGREVADRLKFISQGLAEQWRTEYEQLDSAVGQINQASSDLAKVNDKIREGSVIGRVSNELLDQRDVLVRKLADLAGATAKPAEHGMVNVSIGGVSVVGGITAQKLSISGGQSLEAAAADPPAVMFGDITVGVPGGRTAGLLAGLKTDLPGVSAKLDDIAMAFKDAVNAVHSTGYTLAGDPAGDFFSGTGAGDLAVLISQTADLGVSGDPGMVDGSNATKIGDLAQDSVAEGVLGGISPSQRWRTLASDVGTQVQGLGRALESQQTVLDAADNAVEADAGVNLDEEMSSLLMFQRSYQASARVITTIDEVMDTLINRMGA